MPRSCSVERRLEDNNLVHTVQELWTESTLKLGHNAAGNLFVGETLEPSDEKPMVLVRAISRAPMLEVMMTTVLEKST